MRKEMELAYKRLPKMLTTFGFKKAYIRINGDIASIVVCEQTRPLTLQEWSDFETMIKLDIARNVSIIAKEQQDNLDSYLLIKGSEING